MNFLQNIMNKQKIKILVACHKPANVPHDDIYMPIHVGKAISKYKEEMKNMIGDDTGDNISNKNPYYCELTAQYWAWKNLTDVEYIGLCHYRRFFQTKLTANNIDSILGNKFDVLCVSPIHERINVAHRLILATCLEDYQIFMYCVKKVQPEYFEMVKHFFSHGVVIPYNMFVMKKTLFDKFAEWQFSILTEMEKYVRLSGYSRAKRLYGYYAEMLLPIYLKYNHKKIRFDNWCSTIEGKAEGVKMRNIIYPLNDFLLKINRMGLKLDTPAVLVGFQIDGIDVGKVNPE